MLLLSILFLVAIVSSRKLIVTGQVTVPPGSGLIAAPPLESRIKDMLTGEDFGDPRCMLPVPPYEENRRYIEGKERPGFYYEGFPRWCLGTPNTICPALFVREWVDELDCEKYLELMRKSEDEEDGEPVEIYLSEPAFNEEEEYTL